MVVMTLSLKIPTKKMGTFHPGFTTKLQIHPDPYEWRYLSVLVSSNGVSLCIDSTIHVFDNIDVYRRCKSMLLLVFIMNCIASSASRSVRLVRGARRAASYPVSLTFLGMT